MDELNPTNAWWDRPEKNPGLRTRVRGYSLETGLADGFRIKRVGTGPAPSKPRLTPASPPPADPGQVLDREQAISQAVAALQSPGAASFEFYGPAGTGKTTLLRVLARHPLSAGYRDGVVILSVGYGPLEDVFGALCAAFYEIPVDARPDPRQARSLLGDRQALVLLDDVDLPPEAVDELLTAIPGSDFVLASTQRHLSRPERAMALGGLPAEAALGVFERGLGRPLEPQELPAVRSLCAALRDYPLSLLQAGSYARRLGQAPVELAGEIESAAGPNHALAARLLETLSADERQLVYALAVLGGAAVEAVHLANLAGASSALSQLQKLQEAGLAEVAMNRWRLAGSLGETVLNTWDLSEWKEHALHYFADWTAQETRQAPEDFPEAEVCLALLRWAAGTHRWTDALRLGTAIEGILAFLGRWGSWAEVLEICLQASQALGGRAAEARARHQLGVLALIRGQEQVARGEFVRALRLRQALGDQAGAGLTQANLQVLLERAPGASRRGGLAQPSPVQPQPASARFPAPAASHRRRPVRLLALAGILLLVMALAIPAGLWAGWLLPEPAPATQPIFAVSTLPSRPLLFLPLVLREFSPGAVLLPQTGATATSQPGLQFPAYTISPPTPGPTHTATPNAATAAAQTASPSNCPPPAGWVLYAVQRTDSLPLIAAGVGLTPQELMQANCMNGIFWLNAGEWVWVPRLPSWAVTGTQTAAAPEPTAPAVSATPTQTGQVSATASRSAPTLLVTPIPAEPQADCLEFDDLELYAVYQAGNAFKTAGFPVAINGFLDSNGRLSDGGWAEVVTGHAAGGAGQELQLDNASLSLSLSRPAAGLSLLFNDYSGELNLEINGEFQRLANFVELNGKTLGGTSLSIRGGQGDGAGVLELSGLLRTFRVGGQELRLDRVCFK